MTVATPSPPLVRRATPPETEVGRVLLRGVPWSLYEQLLDLIGDGPQRMTYDNGLLEVEMPSRPHEHCKWIAGRFVEAYMDAFGVGYEAEVSTTWRREPEGGGLEADESYYIKNLAAVAGKDEIDLAVDPPPDLAIEIDLSPPALEKISVYGRLGVPEVWRWRNGELAVLERQADGSYARREQSLALPGFPLEKLAKELARSPHEHQSQAVREFRDWCGQQARHVQRP